MKGTLEFNLDDEDDIRSHERCVKAEDMAHILWEIQYNMKKRLYNLPPETDVIEFFFNWFNEEMTDRGINIDKLIV